MERLTARQQQIFDLIRDNLTTGFPPTRAEIAEKLFRQPMQLKITSAPWLEKGLSR